MAYLEGHLALSTLDQFHNAILLAMTGVNKQTWILQILFCVCQSLQEYDTENHTEKPNYTENWENKGYEKHWKFLVGL